MITHPFPQDLKPANVLNDRERIARLKPQLSQPGGSKRAESTPLFPAIPVFAAGSFMRKHNPKPIFLFCF